jgi:hypothetical protein
MRIVLFWELPLAQISLVKLAIPLVSAFASAVVALALKESALQSALGILVQVSVEMKQELLVMEYLKPLLPADLG